MHELSLHLNDQAAHCENQIEFQSTASAYPAELPALPSAVAINPAMAAPADAIHHLVKFWRWLHEYQLANPERGIGMSTNQLIEPHYYSIANSPTWLREEQKRQVLEFLDEIKDSPFYEDYEEPLMEAVAFGEDPSHVYDPERMREYVRVTENYDAYRKHNILDVSPEFVKIKQDLGM